MNNEIKTLLTKWSISPNKVYEILFYLDSNKNKIEYKNDYILTVFNILIYKYYEYINNNNIYVFDIKEMYVYYLGALLILFSNIQDLLNISTFEILINKAIKISIVCVLVDYAMDDHHLRENNISELKYYVICLKNGKNFNTSISSDIVKSIVFILDDIITEEPLLLDFLIEGINKNLKSLIQKDKDFLDEDFLLKIESDKSTIAYTIILLYLSKMAINDIPSEIGELSQVFDDFMDYDKDKKNGITTIVSIYLDQGKYLHLILHYLKLIDNIPNKYFLFKIIGIISLQYNFYKFKKLINNKDFEMYELNINFNKLFT